MDLLDYKEFQWAFVTDKEGAIIDKVLVPVGAACHADFVESNVSNTAVCCPEQTNEEQQTTEDGELSDYIRELKKRIAASQAHIERIRSKTEAAIGNSSNMDQITAEREQSVSDGTKTNRSSRDGSTETDCYTQPRRHGIWDDSIREVENGYSDLIEAFGQLYVREPITLITKNEILPSSPKTSYLSRQNR